MSNIKQTYEISIWNVSAQNETKLAIIGANDMLTPARAQSPQLKRNVNGTKTLTFSLYTKYIDEIDGIEKINPFCNLIHNETRIKLKWKNKWYEFIVKNIDENSENNQNTYTAEDAFICELSRRGFDIELSTDLENNQGTLIQLEKRFLENSDWKVDEENSIVSPQFKEDILVKLKTTNAIISNEKCEIDEDGQLQISKKEFIIPAGSTIYSFYSILYKNSDFFQFYYDEKGYNFDDDGFIYNHPIYCVENYTYSGKIPDNTSNYELTTNRGKSLVRTQESHYDKVLEKYVKHYLVGNNEEIYGFTDTDYVTDDFVTNIATNSKDFVDDIGWYNLGTGEDANSLVEFYSYPDLETVLDKLNKNQEIENKSYIKITPYKATETNYLFYNTGFGDNKNIVKTLQEGKKFVVRLKYGYKKNDDSLPLDMEIKNDRLASGLNVSLCEYKISEEGYLEPTNTLFKTSLKNEENGFKKDGQFFTAICTCNKNFTEAQLKEANIGLFFTYEFNDSEIITENNFSTFNICIEEFEFFEFKEKALIGNLDDDRNYYLIGEGLSGEAKIKYCYFSSGQEYDDKEDINYLYQGYEEKNYSKKYIPNYQQVRTIEEKESNIFNLTQTLCETFEVWADFVVEHDSLGYIKKDSNGNFIKKIVFKPYTGKKNWSGFHYGINLKSIQRTIESNEITTKSIVKPNYNEHAPNGFCTIAYSDENPSGEAFIYDFRYYENKNLIDSKTLAKDLYDEKEGLYVKLSELNKEIQSEITKRTEASTQLLHLEKDIEILSAKQAELQTSIATDKKQFRTITGISYEKFPSSDKKDSYMNLDDVSSLFLVIFNETEELKKVKVEYSEYKTKYNEENSKYKTSISKIKSLTKQKEQLILNFETKYAPFIQEGTWISNEYIDHNLYYVDAKTVTATSAMPQVTYTIEVIDLSPIEEFKNFDVDIGDKTYITDPNFFGYVEENQFYTPRRQEVIISEMVEELEEPEKNKITVQNYKTQFEDIFHRLTATTIQLKLIEGAYQRASTAFTNNGLDSQVTQNSLNSDNFYLNNNTVEWGSQGLVSTNSKNGDSLKIVDGAIMVSERPESPMYSSGAAEFNSAETTTNSETASTEENENQILSEINKNYDSIQWHKIISSKGINADYIYTGQLDVGKINIVSELKTNEEQELEYAVNFDKDGISMYEYADGKNLRLRLGKVIENIDSEELSELYGLQLYNSTGEQTFRTDSDGNIAITGEISATSGLIGGWGIEENRLVHYTEEELIDAMISTAEQEETYYVNGYSSNNWRLLFGVDGDQGNFGVTSTGNLFANGVDIKDGNISIGDIFKVTSNGQSEQTMTYGLSINLTPENQNEEIVIESNDRIIGIRERRKDGKGWTWKTILGDLTNATLGGKPLSEYGLNGYGLCTENGLFSGAIFSDSGNIGGWEITKNYLTKEFGDKEFCLGVKEEEISDYVIFSGIRNSKNKEFYSLEEQEQKEIKIVIGTNPILEIEITEDIKDGSFYFEELTLVSRTLNSDGEILEEEIEDSIPLFDLKTDTENLKLKISYNSHYIELLQQGNQYSITKMIIGVDYKEKTEFKYDLSNDFQYPEEYKSFSDYIYEQIYGVLPENDEDAGFLVITKKLYIQSMIIVAKAKRILMRDSFVYYKEGDQLIYSISTKGKTYISLDQLEIRQSPKEDLEDLESDSFSNIDPIFNIQLPSITDKYVINDLFFIETPNTSVWSMTNEYFSQNGKTEAGFSLRGKITTTTTSEDGTETVKTTEGILRYEITSEKNKALYCKSDSACDLGTLKNPWGDLYLKHYGKILSFTNKNEKVQLLYVSSSNNITLGYNESTTNHLHTNNINLYGQTVNIMNDLSVTNRILNTYRVGDIYVTSNNSNPSDKLGGTWELINKEFIPSSNRTSNQETVAGEQRVSFVSIKSTKINNSIHLKFIFTMGTANIVGHKKIFNVDLANHGFIVKSNKYFSGSNISFFAETLDGTSSVILNLYPGTASSSNNYGVYGQADQTLTKNTVYYGEVTVPLTPEYMSDSLCNKFYWKRTA